MHPHPDFMWLCLFPPSEWFQLNRSLQLVLRTELVQSQAGGNGRMQSLFQVLTLKGHQSSCLWVVTAELRHLARCEQHLLAQALEQSRNLSGRAGCVLSPPKQRDPGAKANQPRHSPFPHAAPGSWFMSRSCAVPLALHTGSEANVTPSRPGFKDNLWSGGVYLKCVD